MKNTKKLFKAIGIYVVFSVFVAAMPFSTAHATSVVSPTASPSTDGPMVSDLPPVPDLNGQATAPAMAPIQAPVTGSAVPVAPAGTGGAPVPTPAVDGIILPATNSPTPSQSGLTPIPGADSGSATGGANVMGSNVPERHSGTYYDSDAIVPDSALEEAGATGPRKVDPALEPGQTFVVVKKTGAASSFEAQYVAATRALKLGRYAAAMEMFEKLYKKSRKDPRILMGLAVAQQGAGFKESAAATYGELLDVQPNNADAIINLMGIMKDQYPSVTLQRLSDLRGKYPMNAGVPAQMGLANAEMKNYDDALRDFEVAASLDPRNPSHIYNMAIVVDRKGNVPEAIKLYEQALQLDASLADTANGLPREEIYDRLAILRRKI